MTGLLTSWKEIAIHLGKSVRTVQRWERELGLPVRRPGQHPTGIVLADPAELDNWIKTNFLLTQERGSNSAAA